MLIREKINQENEPSKISFCKMTVYAAPGPNSMSSESLIFILKSEMNFFELRFWNGCVFGLDFEQYENSRI